MKIVFMGTPDFAVSALKALHEDGHNISLVVTQPDKPKGRGHKMAPPAVKVFAEEKGLMVYQPLNAKTDEVFERLLNENADLFVVAAYGQILPQRILDIPKYGCINIHASLLPKYRGAAPIQWSIINGEKKTGVTTMQMNAGLDTGDMLIKKEVIIDNTETFETLHDKLAIAGVDAIRETITAIEEGTLSPEKQNDDESTYAPMISKATGYIDFNNDKKSIYNLIRGLNPFPYASTTYKGGRFKVISAVCVELDKNAENGKILDVSPDGILVKCTGGAILIKEVQFEGKKKMPVSEYIKGNKIEIGEILGG
ncbi:MAG: methionyl-tRNA formyltransferase [Clostridia bacterium]|nr:methionyl-tRNA formyltransferase [Clostridia bacterium]